MAIVLIVNFKIEDWIVYSNKGKSFLFEQTPKSHIDFVHIIEEAANGTILLIKRRVAKKVFHFDGTRNVRKSFRI